MDQKCSEYTNVDSSPSCFAKKKNVFEHEVSSKKLTQLFTPFKFVHDHVCNNNI